jgi:hypothetical protein
MGNSAAESRFLSGAPRINMDKLLIIDDIRKAVDQRLVNMHPF